MADPEERKEKAQEPASVRIAELLNALIQRQQLDPREQIAFEEAELTPPSFDVQRRVITAKDASQIIDEITTLILEEELPAAGFNIPKFLPGSTTDWTPEYLALSEFIQNNILSPDLENLSARALDAMTPISKRVHGLLTQQNQLLSAFPARPTKWDRLRGVVLAMEDTGLISPELSLAIRIRDTTDSALGQRGGEIVDGIYANLDDIVQASLNKHGSPRRPGNLVSLTNLVITSESPDAKLTGESLFQPAYGDPAKLRSDAAEKAGIGSFTEKNTAMQAVNQMLQVAGVNTSKAALAALDDPARADAMSRVRDQIVASAETYIAQLAASDPSLVGTESFNRLVSQFVSQQIGPDGGVFQDKVLEATFDQARKDLFEREQEAKDKQDKADEAAAKKAADDAQKARAQERTASGMTTAARNILASFGFTEGDVTDKAFQWIRNFVHDNGQEYTRLTLATEKTDPENLPGVLGGTKLIDRLILDKEEFDITAELDELNKAAAKRAGTLDGAEKIVEQWLAYNGIRKDDILEEDFEILVNQVMAVRGTADLDTITEAQVDVLVQRKIDTEAREALEAGQTIEGARKVVEQILFENEIRIEDIPEERLRQLDQMVANLGEDVVRDVLTKKFLQQFVAEKFNIDALAKLTPESLQAALVKAGAIPQNIPPGFAQHIQKRIIPALIETVVENVRQNLGQPLDLTEVVRGFVTGEQPAPVATDPAALARGEAIAPPAQPGIESGIGPLFEDLNAPVDDPLREVPPQIGTPTGPAPSEIPKFTDFGLLPTAFDPARFDESRPPFVPSTAGRVAFPEVPTFSEQQVSDERLAQIRQLEGLEPDFRGFAVSRIPLLQEEFTRSEEERIKGIRQQAREEATAFTKSGFIQPNQIQGFLDVAGRVPPRTFSTFAQAQFPALRREFEALPETVAAREAETVRADRASEAAERERVFETSQDESERRRRLKRGGRRAVFV